MFINHCARCEKEFTTSKASQGFCSRKCRNAARGAWGWKKAKKAAKVRDGYACQHCGIAEDATRKAYLDVHHIHEMSKTNNNALENLITLCPTCHKAEHDRMGIEMEVAA